MKDIIQERCDKLRTALTKLSKADDEQLVSFVRSVTYGPIMLGFSFGLFMGILFCGMVMFR